MLPLFKLDFKVRIISVVACGKKSFTTEHAEIIYTIDFHDAETFSVAETSQLLSGSFAKIAITTLWMMSSSIVECGRLGLVAISPRVHCNWCHISSGDASA